MTKHRVRAAWLLMLLGALFLVAGLVVVLFATVRHGGGPLGPSPAEPSGIVALADLIMRFVLALLQVEWTPARVGVFLISIGLLLEAGGIYLFSIRGRSR